MGPTNPSVLSNFGFFPRSGSSGNKIGTLKVEEELSKKGANLGIFY